MEDINHKTEKSINTDLLHTALLILICLIAFTGFCMQIVFNYIESKDRQKIMDLQVISMVAGSIANAEQFVQMKGDVSSMLEIRKKELPAKELLPK